MTRRWGRDRQVTSLANVLARTEVFRRAPLPPGFLDAWEQCLGTAGARNGRPLTLRRGVLIIETVEPSWTSQLREMEAEVCGRLRGSGFAVSRLVVRGPDVKKR